MRYSVFITILCTLFYSTANAQQYYTKTGHTQFKSKSLVEKIEADNRASVFVLNTSSGEISCGMNIKSFVFEKKLMQEHFNENYMESDKYPKAIFKGKITNLGEINFSKNGTYQANVSGKMTIHGVTKDFSTVTKLKVNGDKIEFNDQFEILLADYKIDIPNLVKDKISKEVKVILSGVMVKK